MIVPVRCFTCGKVLADKWNFYRNELKHSNDTIINVNAKTVQKTAEGIALDKIRLKRYCCRRVMLSHVNLVSSK